MSHCSLIATQNVHAKHNKLVCHVGYTVLRSVKLGHNKTHETHMHAWQESQKQGGEIGISGSRVDGIRSLPPARTHQKLEVISLSGLRYAKEMG